MISNDNTHGGARPGAGRPAGSTNALSKSQAAQQRFAELVEPKIDDYFNALNDIALSGSEAAKDRIVAIKELLDRGVGRTPQRVEATGEDGGPLFKVYLGIDPDAV